MGRLFDNPNLKGSRMQRVFNAANRYVENIKQTKAYKSMDWENHLANYTNQSRWQEIQDERNSRQYSRGQYMGLSNG